MEKFSSWRDKGTGIAPFVPIVSKRLTVENAVASVIVAVKLPILVIIYVFSILMPRSAVAACFNVCNIKIDFSVDGVRKNNSAKINNARPGANHVVISNFSSPLDILVIFLVSSISLLKEMVVLVPREDKMYQLSALEAMKLPFYAPPDVEKSLPLGKVISSCDHLCGKLVVYWPEGTPSNNKGTLPLMEAQAKLTGLFKLDNFTYSTMPLKYVPGNLTTPIPEITWIGFICRMANFKGVIRGKVFEQGLIAGARRAFDECGLSGTGVVLLEKTKFFESYKLHNVVR